MLSYLKGYVDGAIKLHPELKEEILDLFDLALSEVEAGESEENEKELCINSIEEIIEEQETKDE